MIDIPLLAFLVVVAVAVVRTRDLFAAAMLFAIYSLLSAGLFAVLDAGDVSLTEAAVGAGLSTVMMLAVLTVAKRHEHPTKGYNWPALAAVLVTGGVLAYAATDLPTFGAADNPAQTHVGAYYIANTGPDMGIPNMVAAVLASYRSVDTMGEAFVIFSAALIVYALLGSRPGKGMPGIRRVRPISRTRPPERPPRR